MNKNNIPEDVFKTFLASLEQALSAKTEYHSDCVVHVKSHQHCYPAGLVTVAREKNPDFLDVYNVLHEHPTDCGKLKFVNSGDDYVNYQLAERFGGHATVKMWTLHNVPRSIASYGYKGEKLPTATEVIEYIEKLCAERP